VNVHPAKTEVKFVSDKQVFDGVYYAALGALERTHRAPPAGGAAGEAHAEAAAEAAGEAPGEAARETAGEAPAEAAQKGVPPAAGAPGEARAGVAQKDAPRGFRNMDSDEFRKIYSRDYSKPDNMTVDETPPPRKQQRLPYDNESSGEAESSDAQLTAFGSSLSPGKDFRVIGEVLDTYIVLEYQKSVWFIDKHAAHERIHFDALKNAGYAPMPQSLITPVICRHGHEAASVLLENAELLDSLGFTVESFGDDSVAVRRIPEGIDAHDAEAALSGISAELRRGGTSDSAQRDNIYRTIACKAAIKAGRSSEPRELEALAARVMSGEITHCPHGRPVAFELTKATLDKGFKRT